MFSATGAVRRKMVASLPAPFNVIPAGIESWLAPQSQEPAGMVIVCPGSAAFTAASMVVKAQLLGVNVVVASVGVLAILLFAPDFEICCPLTALAETSMVPKMEATVKVCIIFMIFSPDRHDDSDRMGAAEVKSALWTA